MNTPIDTVTPNHSKANAVADMVRDRTTHSGEDRAMKRPLAELHARLAHFYATP